MLVNRAEGLAKSSLYCVLLLNLFGFLVYFAAIYLLAGQWFRLSADTLLYLIAIVIAVFYASRRIVGTLSRIEPVTALQAAGLAFRVQIGFIIGASFIYFLKEDLYSSRLFLMAYGVLMLPLNLGALLLVPRLLASRFYPNHVKSKSVIICSRDGTSGQLKTYIQHCQRLGVVFVGYASEQPSSELDLPYLGSLDQLIELRCEGLAFDSVLSWGVDLRAKPSSGLLEFCQEEGIRLQIHARFANGLTAPLKIVQDENLNFIAFPHEPLEDPLHRAIKRAIDLAISLPVCVLVLLPMMGCVWIVQRLQSPGPLLYGQIRYGISRQPFKIIKFRTMHVRENIDLHEEARQATRDDPRVYPIGRFLRKTSLDEFPQFWNVLRGEMSIVGPRPHPVKLDEILEPQFRAYRSRHFVKPGITGLAQVNGFRGEVTSLDQLHGRIRKDLDYIYNWSVTKDLKIILLTIRQVFTPPGSAY